MCRQFSNSKQEFKILEREILEMDVVFVGAGPANLSGALHLSRLIREHNEAVSKGEKKGQALGDLEIGVIEKGGCIRGRRNEGCDGFEGHGEG